MEVLGRVRGYQHVFPTDPIFFRVHNASLLRCVSILRKQLQCLCNPTDIAMQPNDLHPTLYLCSRPHSQRNLSHNILYSFCSQEICRGFTTTPLSDSFDNFRWDSAIPRSSHPSIRQRIALQKFVRGIQRGNWEHRDLFDSFVCPGFANS